jgi:hypothetical protein
MNGRIVPGGLADDWLDMVNACTADGLHHVTLRTAGRLHDADHADYDNYAGHDSPAASGRLLRVWYAGPQRLRTYDKLRVDTSSGGRVELIVEH